MTGARPSIGFAGLGRMGSPMCRNLVAAGFAVTGFSRTPAAHASLREAGAEITADFTRLAGCEVLISMLPDLPEFAQLVDESDLLVGYEGTLLVMSSVSPVALRQFGERVSRTTAGRAEVVDAPVTGGVAGAEAGTLAIMVGGSDTQFSRLAPVFETLGTMVRHMGPVGAGSTAKACNQVIVAAIASAIGEALVLGEAAGLDLAVLLEVVGAGMADSAFLRAKHVQYLAADYRPAGAARLMLKDLRAAQDAALVTSTVTPVTDALEPVFSELVANGLGDLDLSVVREAIRRASVRSA